MITSLFEMMMTSGRTRAEVASPLRARPERPRLLRDRRCAEGWGPGLRLPLQSAGVRAARERRAPLLRARSDRPAFGARPQATAAGRRSRRSSERDPESSPDRYGDTSATRLRASFDARCIRAA